MYSVPTAMPYRFFSDLGLIPPDNIDALWIDGTYAFGSVHIFFSLAPGSPGLFSVNSIVRNPYNITGWGCDPGDILVSVTGPGVAGTGNLVPPFVICPAGSIGLSGNLVGDAGTSASDDNLDALDVTGYGHIPIVWVPVELSKFTAEK